MGKTTLNRRHLDISNHNLQIFQDLFCCRVDTIHNCDPETKRQSMSWKRTSSPPVKKNRFAPKKKQAKSWPDIDIVTKRQTITGPFNPKSISSA